jgi:hypothetical protein
LAECGEDPTPDGLGCEIYVPCMDPEEVPDFDGDGVSDFLDNCVSVVNPDQLDTDADGLGDVCDETPEPAGPVGRWPVSRLTAASPFSVWVRLHVAGRTFYLLVVAEGQKAKLFFLAKATQQRA